MNHVDNPQVKSYVLEMITTLREGQNDLPRLVELASRGEDVVIMVDGEPKAKLTRAEPTLSGTVAGPAEMLAWVKELEELRQVFGTGQTGLSGEQILEETRADRV